jgi:hypothetical protein
MRVAIIVLLVVAVAVAGFGWSGAGGPAPAPPPALPPSAVPDEALARRVAALEARLDEMAAAVERQRKETAEARESERRAIADLARSVEKRKEEADAAQVLLAAATGETKKPEDLDAFAKEVSKGMRQGIREEFRKISDLVTNPTPEALDARRRQLRMFAGAMSAAAGLDQAQAATFERILNDTDERARDDLRPILQGVDDYRKVDYARVKKVTEDTFAVQDQEIAKEFPKDKAERLQRQLEPIRNIFGAMLDELGKQAAAEAPK